jgi:hypothetical protein
MTETTFEEEPGLVRVLPGHPDHGSTRRVARVLPDCCTCQFFNKPRPVQPLKQFIQPYEIMCTVKH